MWVGAVLPTLAVRTQRNEEHAHAGDEADNKCEDCSGERPNDDAGKLPGEQHNRQEPRRQGPHEILTPFPARPTQPSAVSSETYQMRV
jgi:hypothetical protein